MSVYVDALMAHDPTRMDAATRRAGAHHGHRWCHMIADTEAELHAMAARIGMKRAWFQGDHYDLVPTKRGAAITFGALALDRRAFVAKLRMLRSAASRGKR